MKLHLFTEAVPDRRRLLFAHRFATLVDLDEEESLEAAQRLFDCHYGTDNPLVVQARINVNAADIDALCSEFGINVRSS
ncbi:MAG: hypothetical protein KDA91_22110 [Planctomycetaceae bacterium]|nr:hypothetical protein [Planctomycetaceae bacterium]